MLELMLETWSTPRAGKTYRWSVWDAGKRIAAGGAHEDVEGAEEEGRRYCAELLKRSPDRVTRL
jgi:hypothetical protein